MARVWPDVVVTENNLQVQISALRRALDEGSNGESLLVTVPGRGYRLVGIDRRRPEPQRASRGARQRPAVPDKPSIAVLPFANMSGDPEQEYFADGIVEDIITALSRFALAVRDRAQFQLHLQGQRRRREAGRARARRALRARRQRAQGGVTGCGSPASYRCDDRRASLGRPLRRRARRHLRPAGPGDASVVGAIAPKLGRPRSSGRSASRPRASTPTTLSARHRLHASRRREDTERGVAAFRPRDRARSRLRRAAMAPPPSATCCASSTAGRRPGRRSRRPIALALAGGGTWQGRCGGARPSPGWRSAMWRAISERALGLDRPGAGAQSEPRDRVVRERRDAGGPRRRAGPRDRSSDARDAPQPVRSADVRHEA